MMWCMQCVSVRGDLTRHRYTLKELVLQKVLGVFCEIDVRRVHIDFAKVHGVLCESDIGKMLVDFIQIERFFINCCQ